MNTYVLFPAFDKVLIASEDADVDERLLALIKSLPEVQITDLTPYYCEAKIPEKHIKDIEKKLKAMKGEIHKAETPVLIDPIKPPDQMFRDMLFGKEEE